MLKLALMGHWLINLLRAGIRAMSDSWQQAVSSCLQAVAACPEFKFRAADRAGNVQRRSERPVSFQLLSRGDCTCVVVYTNLYVILQYNSRDCCDSTYSVWI